MKLAGIITATTLIAAASAGVAMPRDGSSTSSTQHEKIKPGSSRRCQRNADCVEGSTCNAVAYHDGLVGWCVPVTPTESDGKTSSHHYQSCGKTGDLQTGGFCSPFVPCCDGQGTGVRGIDQHRTICLLIGWEQGLCTTLDKYTIDYYLDAARASDKPELH